MRNIAISGASGFVGTHLKKYLSSLNFNVLQITRDELNNLDKLIKIINKSSIVINLNGANILQKKWSEKYKKVLYNSRIESTKNLVKAFEKAGNKPNLFISTSGVSVYKGDKIYNEFDKDYANDFLANLAKDWENEALKANNLNIRTVIFRFGVVLEKDGGSLKQMLPPFKMGLGGIIGDGKQKFPFIHMEDLQRAYKFIIENNNLSGIFNLTAPQTTTNYGLTKTLGKQLKRPTFFKIPIFVFKLVYGEGVSVLINGQEVYPQRLLDNGFKFNFNNIEDALSNIVK